MKVLLIILFPFFAFGQQEDTTIVDFPDVEAEFPGGQARLLNFIITNIVYPDTIEYEENPPSKFYFSFIVEKDGSITQIKNERSSSDYYAKSHIDVLSKMPRWIPAKVNGEAVRSRCRLPIILHYD
ncbi:energy transducer TonB [bacterium]|nr:energy transducer TonB [bacterium]